MRKSISRGEMINTPIVKLLLVFNPLIKKIPNFLNRTLLHSIHQHIYQRKYQINIW